MMRIRTIAGMVWLEMLRKKDIYVLLMLMGMIVVSLLFVNAFNITGASSYIKDVGLLLAWVFSWILSIGISARELPHEEKTGTIYPLLAKPMTRLELILGKWLGTWTIASVATLCFYALVVGVVYLGGGGFAPVTLVQGFLLHAGALAIICALALALSTRMNYDAAATFCFAVTIGAFLILPRVPELLNQTGFENLQYWSLLALYSILPHFELFDMRQRMVHDGSPADWKAVGAVLYYGFHMSAVFLLTAWLGYARKRFSRGEIK